MRGRIEGIAGEEVIKYARRPKITISSEGKTKTLHTTQPDCTRLIWGAGSFVSCLPLRTWASAEATVSFDGVYNVFRVISFMLARSHLNKPQVYRKQPGNFLHSKSQLYFSRTLFSSLHLHFKRSDRLRWDSPLNWMQASAAAAAAAAATGSVGGWSCSRFLSRRSIA